MKDRLRLKDNCAFASGFFFFFFLDWHEHVTMRHEHVFLSLALSYLRDLSEISRGEGGGNRGRVTTFWDCRKGRGHEKWAVKRGRVMQIYARDHVEVHPQKKKEVLYLVKKRKQTRTKEQYGYKLWSTITRIQVNKHLLFIYNNAIESYCNYE